MNRHIVDKVLDAAVAGLFDGLTKLVEAKARRLNADAEHLEQMTAENKFYFDNPQARNSRYGGPFVGAGTPVAQSDSTGDNTKADISQSEVEDKQ